MRKKIGMIIEARTGSKRLPKKILKKINGITILEHLIKRIKKQTFIKEIIVATTNKKSDIAIAKICKEEKIKCFCGSENNLIKRVYSAAEHFNITDIVQLTSDNPLVDLKILQQLLGIYKKNQYIFVTNSYYRTYPIGTDIRIFNTKKLKNTEKLVPKKFRQHTAYYFLKNFKKLNSFNLYAKGKYNSPDIRLTLDFIDDFKLIKKVFKKMKKYKYFNILKIINYLNKNSKIKNLNSQHAKHFKL